METAQGSQLEKIEIKNAKEESKQLRGKLNEARIKENIITANLVDSELKLRNKEAELLNCKKNSEELELLVQSQNEKIKEILKMLLFRDLKNKLNK